MPLDGQMVFSEHLTSATGTLNFLILLTVSKSRARVLLVAIGMT